MKHPCRWRLSPVPLRIAPGRFYLWSAVIAGSSLVVMARGLHAGWTGDWQAFAYAAQHVGSASLLAPPEPNDAFPYPPGAAWIFAPAAHLSMLGGYLVNAAVMVGCAVAAALVAARVYALPQSVTIALTLAWFPALYPVIMGQNADLGLLLVLCALLGAQRGSVLGASVPIGLLLYKPTYALPFLVLFLVRGRWRELGIVAAMGAGWYVASAWAADAWNWLPAWRTLVAQWYGPDIPRNAAKALGLVTLMQRFGAPPASLVAASVAAALPALSLLRRDWQTGYAVAGVMMLMLSPHAWTYDAVLLLPTVFLVVTRAPEPWRTRLVLWGYRIAFLAVVSPPINPLALVVLGAYAGWLVGPTLLVLLAQRQVGRTVRDAVHDRVGLERPAHARVLHVDQRRHEHEA